MLIIPYLLNIEECACYQILEHKFNTSNMIDIVSIQIRCIEFRNMYANDKMKMFWQHATCVLPFPFA